MRSQRSPVRSGIERCGLNKLAAPGYETEATDSCFLRKSTLSRFEANLVAQVLDATDDPANYFLDVSCLEVVTSQVQITGAIAQ